jgi:hypothetical protein
MGTGTGECVYTTTRGEENAMGIDVPLLVEAPSSLTTTTPRDGALSAKTILRGLSNTSLSQCRSDCEGISEGPTEEVDKECKEALM